MKKSQAEKYQCAPNDGGKSGIHWCDVSVVNQCRKPKVAGRWTVHRQRQFFVTMR